MSDHKYNTTPDKLYIKELDLELINPSTKTFNDPTQGGSKTVVIGKPGCFAPGTKVLMHNGDVKNVEDVKQGEQVMGDDSTERTVLELCHNQDEMYRITPLSGDEPYVVNRMHKLVLTVNNVIIEITVEDFLKNSVVEQEKWSIFKTAVEFPEIETETDPYDMGALLGNGSNNFLEIPREFKINSKKNRLELLAGLLDSRNSGFEFEHKNESLFNDVLFLIRSLGFSANKNREETTFKCSIKGDLNKIPCRKMENPLLEIKENFLTSKFTIEPQGEGEYYGFTISGNHRFLLATFDVVRNTGKSTLIASLLYAKRHIFPVGMVFSGTEDSNHFYERIFPRTFIYNNYDEDQLRSFVKRQKIAKEHCQNPWAVVLSDDCTDDPRIFNKPLQQGMFKRGRHWKMWYILSLQYCMDVKPVIRTNVDGTFILREPNLKNRRSLWENYAGCIPDFGQFCDIMDELTDNFTALYIHNATRSNKLEDCLFWYKAKPIPDGFKLGCPEFWEFDKARYNENYVEPFLP